MKRMRAKFKVQEVSQVEGGEKLSMSPVCAKSFGEGGVSEDNDFSKYTPSGELRIFITNENLFGIYKPGQTYYLDLTPAD